MDEDRDRGRARLGIVEAAHLLWGLSLVVLVGVDGTFRWRVVGIAVVAVLTFGAIASWRTGDRSRALPALAHGVIGVVVGAAIGVRHLTKDGLSLDAAAGLVALATGVVLLVAGVRVLAVGRSRRAAIALTVATVVAVALAAWVAVPAVLVTNVPPIAPTSATPTDRGLDHRDIRFITQDGVPIAAWYVPTRTGAAVVLRHGAGTTRADVLRHAEVLAGQGLGVLITDARGHGASGGRAMDFGWYGDADIRAALDALAEQDGVDADRLGVVGTSMGGEEAIGAAADDDRIRVVVAEGATARVAGDKDWYSEVYGVRGSVQELLERAQYGLTDLLTAAEPPISLRSAVARSDARFLLIAAGDVPEEQHAAADVRAGAPERVEVWTVDGSGHTAGLATDPTGWQTRVAELLGATIGTNR